MACADKQGEDHEAAQTKVAAIPKAVSAQEKDEHETSGHAVFRVWCKQCAGSRSWEDPRYAAPPVTESDEVQQISLDYAYMGSKE